MIRQKCKVKKKIWGNENYQVLSCVPNVDMPNVKLSDYGNFTVKDTMLMLEVDKWYELELEETEFRGQIQYNLISVPSMNEVTIESLTDEVELEILNDITTPEQAHYVHEAYPNFIRLVLEGKEDTIDTKRIYNVGKKRLAVYVREVNTKYKYYAIMHANSEYKLKLQECKNLASRYGSVEDVNKAIEDNPYEAIIGVCERSFITLDAQILSMHPEFKESEQRAEYLMLYILKQNEDEGNTYLNAKDMAEYINGYAPELLGMVKNVANKSELIHFDNDDKILARMVTYMCEVHMAEFVKDKIDHPTPFDIDVSKYREGNKITLTDTQMNALDNLCKYNLSILLGYSGTGKSSSVDAIIHMLEENELSYVLMAPTGKAASRLKELTGRQAYTMHRYIMDFHEIYSDVLIVDEFSFFGTEWADMLINAIANPEIHILLVGDNAQLNPISYGKVFQDLIDFGLVPITKLTEVFRYNEGGLSKVATDIRLGKNFFNDCAPQDNVYKFGNDYTFIETTRIKEALLSEYNKLISQGISPNDITCISPYNIGDYGCYELNNEIQKIINPIGPNDKKHGYSIKRKGSYDITLHASDYVMNIQNDYNALTFNEYRDTDFDDDKEHCVFNGDCGKVVGCDDEVVMVKFDEDIIVYTKEKLSNLILSMVVSAHRMQGSQNKYIISIVSPDHERMLTRNLLYVANTRASIEHISIGSKDTMLEAMKIEENKQRNTLLIRLLGGSQ